jgi:hypothetical protein
MTSILRLLDKNGDGIVDTDNWGPLAVNFGKGFQGPTDPTGPTGPAGQGALPVIRTGNILYEPVNTPNNDIIGNYTWYQLFTFQGLPNTQGVEVKVYMLVCRVISSFFQNPTFTLLLPTPFNAGYGVADFVHNQFNTNKAIYNIAFTTDYTGVTFTTQANTISDNSFIFFIYGI